jgi:hypothetical protein
MLLKSVFVPNEEASGATELAQLKMGGLEAVVLVELRLDEPKCSIFALVAPLELDAAVLKSKANEGIAASSDDDLV